MTGESSLFMEQTTLSLDSNVTSRYCSGMFVKLFAQILDSSIADNRKLRHFFTDLLLCADASGNVMMTDSAISRRIGADMQEVEWGLKELSSPDPRSKTPDHEGRRIERIEDHGYGWRILNYELYRSLRDAEQLREATRIRVQRCRDKKKGSNGCNAMQKENAEGEENTEEESIRSSGSWNPTVAQVEVAAWFGMRPATKWDVKWQKKWKEIVEGFDFSSEDYDALKWYYTESGCKFLRKDLGTLLNNWQGEITRAKNYEPEKR